MRVGFTGNRHGMTLEQKRTFVNELSDLVVVEFHYGDCVGADDDAFWICRGVARVLHAHPATLGPEWDAQWQARTAERFPNDGIVEHPPLHPLKRNKMIVNSSDLLYACPEEFEEKLRSGTWSTVRYAVANGKPVRIILPDGSIKEV
jgi:hypothetical protein